MPGVDVISGSGGLASDCVFFLIPWARELVFAGGLEGVVELVVGHAVGGIPGVGGLAKQVVLVGFDGFGKPISVFVVGKFSEVAIGFRAVEPKRFWGVVFVK